MSGTSRKLKPAELLKTDTTANPISDKYIQDKKEEKKAASKVINSIVRNAKMTLTAARAAVVQQDEPKQKRTIKKRKIFDL